MFKHIEQNYVVDFYNNNARSFDDTRYAPWPVVKQFLDSLPAGASVCDIGCGNGKNQYRKDLIYTSCDNSKEMCTRVPNSLLCNCTELPFTNNTFEHAICIAVLHHLANEERRLKALQEIKRILKSDGSALISVWGCQPKFGNGDQIIGWNCKQQQRYIHFFTKDEIQHLCAQVFHNFTITEDYNNYFVKVICKSNDESV